MKKLLLLILFFTLTSCSLFKNSLPEEIPDDFSFSIMWNTDGISSYDSKTGILIKDKYATNPNEYTTTYFFK